jgi:hypothetical protein
MDSGDEVGSKGAPTIMPAGTTNSTAEMSAVSRIHRAKIPCALTLTSAAA